MNSLSWMIYLAAIAGSIGFVCGAVCVIGGMATIFSWAYGSFSSYEEDRKVGKAAFKKIFRIWIIACVVGTVIPGRETIYAIAASEYGEDVLKSPEANKARQALNAWLDKQIGDAKPEKSK